jgi:alpha-1,2-mannosyltransferase
MLTAMAGGPAFVRLVRTLGPVFAAVGAVVAAVTWPRAFDLEAYLDAARLSAAGGDPYSATRAAGIDDWGQGQVFVSPPFVAHVLAPFSSLPTDVVWVLWTTASLLALGAAIRLLDRDTLVARAPVLAFSFVYLWGSLWMGQVNLFALAGLLLAFGARTDRLAGFGLALAVVTRALPGAFALVLLLERRWRALAWSAVFAGLVVLIRPADWMTYLQVAREASGLPTLPVIVQTSLAPYPPLWVAAGIAVAAVVAIAAVVEKDRRLLAGTAVGFAIVLLPTNAWHHWLTFAMAPLLLYGDGSAWSRATLLALVVVSILPIGSLSAAVTVLGLAAAVAVSARGLRDEWPRIRAGGAGILGRP